MIPEEEQPEHLDQIRDIIFGPQKREFEGRVKELETQLESVKADITVAIDSLNAKLVSELRTLSETVGQRFSAFEEKSNADRAAIARTLVELRTTIDAVSEATNRSFGERLQTLQVDIHNRQTELERNFTTALHSTNSNVSERWSSLDAGLVRLARITDDDRTQLHEKLASSEQRFDASLQSIVQIAKENIAAVGEQVRLLEQSKNADRDELAKSLASAQLRLDKAIQNAIQSASEKTAAVDAAFRAENLRLQQELASARDRWASELETRTTELTESKVSREMMAEALIELGMKVKAGERLSELKLLTKKPTQ